MASPIELEVEDQHLNLVVVVKDTVSMVLEISYLQVVSLSVDLQSNVFIGAMADLIPQVLVWIPWTFSWQVNILAYAISSRPDLFDAVHDVSLMTPTEEGRLMAATTDMADVYLLYDSFATVWSALSWPYQLHLMITALAVGS
ncbi:hypothetical protein O0I10_001071 [Lichtheimia ornata]|uniref:Uncharacterized protein n=1 Tax=Lichtheimia ornata TaxID=688661 RepID=A0AAD8DHG8_9FUNG|nr:uncharacterized protein O0I10_001071 [Lichtheimia ornata]KAJ8662895.1 hypothetical protein O0I10_001071 [Lichtheimia ornata]